MKKKLFILCLFLAGLQSMFSQALFITEAPVFDNSTSTGRGPNGTSAHVYQRAAELVRTSELTGIASGATLSSFGFTLNAGATTTAPTGNFTVYLQNTSDVTYSKGTTWSTVITGMTTVYASTMTIPVSAGTTSVMLTLSTPFVYTGGGIYVAYDWYNPGPYSSTSAVYRCNSGGLSPGCASNASNVSAPTTLGTTAFRPCILFGVSNTYTNEVSITGMEAPGRVAGMFNTGHNVKAMIRNNSNTALNNIPVTLNVSGANTFANTQTVSTLAAGSTTTISFSTFNPLINGLNTLSVSVPADQNNANNSSAFSQSVTCNEWAFNPTSANYTLGSVGFNTGSGIIAATYTNPVSSTLTAVRMSVSTNTPSIGNSIWGVVLNSGGAILATTNTVSLTGAMLGTMQTFTFSSAQGLSPSTVYHIGIAQSTGTIGYFPIGTYTSSYVPFANYVTTALSGGTPAPLTANLGYAAMEAIFLAVSPTVTVSSPTVTCGSQATLAATTSASYSWTSGPANANYLVTPTVSSIYTVNVVDQSGCAGSKTTAVTINPLPISVTNGTICSGLNFAITPSGATSYSFSDGTTTTTGTSANVSPATTTNYTVTGSNTNGCTGSDTLTLNVNPSPTVTVNNATICSGLPGIITPSGAVSYTISGNSFTVTPSSTTTYSIVGTGSNNCISDVAVSTISVNSTPVVSVNSGSICSGDSFTIAPTGASTYTITGNNFTVSPAVTTSYSVTGTNNEGCVSSNASVSTVTVYSLPSITIASSSSTICEGSSVVLTAGGSAVTYSWSSSQTGTTISLTPSVTTTFTVKGVDTNGCVNNAIITQVVDPCTGLSMLSSLNTIAKLYPNPTSGSFVVEAPEHSEISVFSTSGKVVHFEKTSGFKTTITLPDLAKGVYLVKIVSSAQSQTMKIIKE